MISLGDIAVLGPDPAGVVRWLRPIGRPKVLGNTDAWLIGPDAAEPSSSVGELVGRPL